MSSTKSSLISEQKKRAFEALERRFAFDKVAKQLQEENHNNKKNKTNSLKEEKQGLPTKQRRDNSSSSKKSFIGAHTPLRRELTSGCATGAEDDHPIYSELSLAIHDNLLGTASEDSTSSKADAVNKIVFDLLQHGDKGHKYTKGSIALKIDNWLLLDNYVPKNGSTVDAHIKALQSHSKRSKKHMTKRQLRRFGSHDFSKEFHDFNLFKPMHEMWKEYIMELVKENREKQLAQCLIMAELHGALLLVVECKTASFKGNSGIMIRETAETFGLITQDNRFRVVPKRGSVFIFQAGCWKITLHGDNLSLRNNAL